ncbi:hypothetical protein F5Y12DRAFT_392454 [Xylaria sp. FL1777]|nr:hypothetical protein F5Y12DRAFT_392454 [Xylaria sp. FL1777]
MAEDNARPAVVFDRDQSQWPLAFALKPPQGETTPRRWWRHYYYRGPQGQPVQVLYSRTKSQSETIARQFIDEPVLGFDMEWPWDADKRPRLQDKVALIQLASERKVALFHIALHEGETTDDLIAPTLKEIIESSKVIKAGVAVLSADFKRLRAHFNLEPKGAFELSHLHNLITYGASNPQQVTTKLRSLSMQVERHLGLPLWKGNVRTSDWSRPLNPSQTEYAATDAYAGFMLFHCMNAKRLAMDPAPPLPVFAEAYLPLTTSRSTTIQLESVTEDGEVRITTVDKFFKVRKDVEEGTEAIKGRLSIGDSNKGETSTSEEAGTSQEANIEPTSKNDKSKRSRNRVRARDDKSQTDAKVAGKNSGKISMDSSCWALCSRLASHRQELAVSQGIPAFIIAHNTVLQALAMRRPSNKDELLLVPGVGKHKASQYGPSWLEIIADFEKEQKQDGDNNKEQVDNQAEHAGFPIELKDPDLKRRKIVSVGRSKEILMASDKLPAVLSTGVSFWFGETSLADKTPVPLQSEEQDDSEADDAAFEPPMQPPSLAALKRKRDFTVQSHHGAQQQSPSQRAIQTPTALSRVNVESATGLVSITHVDLKPRVVPAPVLIPTSITTPVPAVTNSKLHLLKQPEHFNREKTVLHNKMQAYVKSVVWAMHPKPTEPLVSEDTLHHLITTLPQTVEEFRRVPGIQRLMKACEIVKMDIWQTFEKWMRSPGLVSHAGSSR